MGRKSKKGGEGGADAAVQPFCYYCDREFDTEAVVIAHQKSRHFKCASCGKRMTTLGALLTHARHVHKETLKAVPNAREGREDLSVQVYGMDGVPDDILEAPAGKRMRVHGHDDDGEGEGECAREAAGSCARLWQARRNCATR